MESQEQIVIDSDILKEVKIYAVSMYPEESCGILYGSDQIFDHFLEIQNIESFDKRERFVMDSKKVYDLLFNERPRLFMTFHAHIIRGTRPSHDDLDGATGIFSTIPHLIVSLLDIHDVKVRVWRYSERAEPEEIPYILQ